MRRRKIKASKRQSQARQLILKRSKIIKTERIVGPNDFVYKEGEQVDFVKLWQNEAAYISPFCIDDERKCMIFVRTIDDVDLQKTHPFFYQAQRNNAKYLYAVPYDQIHDLARSYSFTDSDCIFIFSTGRCGSTLLCKIMEDMPQVQSLSEPDLYSQIAILRTGEVKEDRDAEFIQILASYNRLLCHHARSKNPASPVVVIKLRGLCNFLCEQIHKAVPNTKSIFLYRNADDVINSYYGAFFNNRMLKMVSMLRLEHILLRVIYKKYNSFISPIFSSLKDYYDSADFTRNFISFLTFIWVSQIDQALRMQNKYQTLFSAIVRYEELKLDPISIVRQLLISCGVSINEKTDFEEMKKKLYANSQAGLRIASKGEIYLKQKDIALIQQLLSKHKIIKDRYFVMPNTMLNTD